MSETIKNFKIISEDFQDAKVSVEPSCGEFWVILGHR